MFKSVEAKSSEDDLFKELSTKSSILKEYPIEAPQISLFELFRTFPRPRLGLILESRACSVFER